MLPHIDNEIYYVEAYIQVFAMDADGADTFKELALNISNRYSDEENRASQMNQFLNMSKNGSLINSTYHQMMVSNFMEIVYTSPP